MFQQERMAQCTSELTLHGVCGIMGVINLFHILGEIFYDRLVVFRLTIRSAGQGVPQKGLSQCWLIRDRSAGFGIEIQNITQDTEELWIEGILFQIDQRLGPCEARTLALKNMVNTPLIAYLCMSCKCLLVNSM